MDGHTNEGRARVAHLLAGPAHVMIPGAADTGPAGPAELKTDADRRLPTRGRHYNRIHLEASPHYQGEFELHLDSAGNGGLRVGLDVGDLAELRSALPGRQGATAVEVREYLEVLIRAWDPDPARLLDGMAGRSVDALRRVIAMLGEA